MKKNIADGQRPPGHSFSCHFLPFLPWPRWTSTGWLPAGMCLGFFIDAPVNSGVPMAGPGFRVPTMRGTDIRYPGEMA